VTDVRVDHSGTVDVVEAHGELDMANVNELNDALRNALSDDTTSCLLDLSSVTFLDSSVIHALIRWSHDAQLSEREALAIVIGADTVARRLLGLVGLTSQLPVFESRDAALTALREGQRSRAQRSLEWLTDAELGRARRDAEQASDVAARRLEDISREERRRSDDQDDELAS
jgi:anti-anti-sigma factor